MNEIVEKAISCLGRGFDVTCDFRLKFCRGKKRLVSIDEDDTTDLLVPGFGRFQNVPARIKCDKGDRVRFQSDVLSFSQMAALLNERSSLGGKIPNGVMNALFGLSSENWGRDASNTKCLALDGYLIALFNLQIDRYPLTLSPQVTNTLPATWQPRQLARFIQNYGTHIIVGVSVGGQDVVLVKQAQSSKMLPSQLKKHLDELGDQLFTGACTLPPLQGKKSKGPRTKVPEAFKVFDPQPVLVDSFSSMKTNDGVTVICTRRGGEISAGSHCEWLLTVPSMPDAINFTFVPITSLLKGVPGIGYLSHAINLYLRYKPPVGELESFLDFQSPKIWAPLHSDLPLGPPTSKAIPTPALHFNLMGSKLYVNTSQVTVGRRPVTGMRLYLEGNKCNRLAVHLQHLSNIPSVVGNQIDETSIWRGSDETTEESYFAAVHWKKFSHVCTATVKYDPNWSPSSRDVAFVVTGAQLIVKKHDAKSVLNLRLQFSKVSNVIVSRSVWEQGSSDSSPSTSFFSTISASLIGNAEKEKQMPIVIIDSGVFPTGPPVPVQSQKLLKFVDVSHVCKGPRDSPGHWLVTGAKLDVEKGKISIHVKFSLLSCTSWEQ